MARRKPSTSKAALARKALKRSNFPLWKSRTLRSSWLTRCKKVGMDPSLVPTAPQIQEWLIGQAPFKCAYTGVSLGVNFEADHMVPLSRGGGPGLGNIVLTTPLLNGAKGNLTAIEFKQLLKVISKWDDRGLSLLQRLRRGHF